MDDYMVNQKRQVQMIAIVTAICLLGDSMLYVVLPTHWNEAGLTSLWEIGVLLSVNRFVRLPLHPFISSFYEKMGKRTGILIAVILSVITTLSYGLFQNFWILVVMRCIWGMAWTLLKQGAYFSILELSNDQNRGYFTGIYNGLYRLGSLFGMLLGGFFADLYGLSIVAKVFGTISIFALPLVYFSVPNSTKKNEIKEELERDRFEILMNPSFLKTLATGLIVTMLFQGMFIAILSHVINVRYPTTFVFGVTLGAASLAGILQAIRWGWEPWLAPWFGKISDRSKGRRSILVKSLLITSVLFFSVSFEMPFGLLIFVLLGVQLAATLLTTVIDAIALDSAANSSKVAAAVTSYSISTDLGAAIGPTLGYFLLSTIGMEHMYWITSVLFLLLFLGWCLPWRKNETFAAKGS